MNFVKIHYYFPLGVEDALPVVVFYENHYWVIWELKNIESQHYSYLHIPNLVLDALHTNASANEEIAISRFDYFSEALERLGKTFPGKGFFIEEA